MDTVSKKHRSEIMSHIKSKDTTPEMIVRRLVHRLGYRYRLHSRQLPGTPDLVFRSRMKVIFVHGCFWHLHRGCPGARMPKTRKRYWRAKLGGNALRDAQVMRSLSRMGWRHLTIWECQTRQDVLLAGKIRIFLDC